MTYITAEDIIQRLLYTRRIRPDMVQDIIFHEGHPFGEIEVIAGDCIRLKVFTGLGDDLIKDAVAHAKANYYELLMEALNGKN